MPASKFCVYFDGVQAELERLEQIEEIVVEQAVDKPWQARAKLPICVDEKGRWSDEDTDFMKPFSRMRVEVAVGEGGFVALIDGPIVGLDVTKDSQPGQSAITLVIQDDSVYLNRHEEIRDLGKKSDSDVAKDLFKKVGQLASHVVDDTGKPAGSLPPKLMQRGTAMSLLRKLARCQGMHVYVLPGSDPGKSIAHFNKFPGDPPTLPTMHLLGEKQNIRNFQITEDAQSPIIAKTAKLQISNKGTISGTSSFKNLKLLGPQAPEESKKNLGTQLSKPRGCPRVDPKRLVKIDQERKSYSIEATGEIMEGCYSGVLTPYQQVMVMGVNGHSSGTYRIKKVTHAINLSNYTQSFTLTTNSVSEGSLGAVAAGVPEKIFG